MSEPITINGFINIEWLKEQSKDMTSEKEKAILKRNELLSQVPINQKEKWLENNPLEKFK